ncbi:LysR family transcriptional regulator [Rhizobium leguminosarum bv. viciae]|uniref:LysR family transcriptional regulator n=1 Tax=Rhizobium leguminosarum TaxID=384 RepID=UPI0014426EF5|nr:LysR family transcriptional regulator [Rhizobium leguminosarum]NKK68738.1 LysR family transcriptional regulator [Rhizobium leguminosarum bv. viciae]
MTTLDRFQLEALIAVLRTASFERAAKILRITPSVPQQIRAPEDKLAVLIVRGHPCRPTHLERGYPVTPHDTRTTTLTLSERPSSPCPK